MMQIVEKVKGEAGEFVTKLCEEMNQLGQVIDEMVQGDVALDDKSLQTNQINDTDYNKQLALEPDKESVQQKELSRKNDHHITQIYKNMVGDGNVTDVLWAKCKLFDWRKHEDSPKTQKQKPDIQASDWE